MLPASNKGVGMNMGFPDVCLTPSVPSPIPIPYPNMAMHAMATPGCPTILLTMMPALNMASVIPMTMGDEPGVAHPFFKQMGMFVMGNPKVFLQGVPAVTLTSPTAGNNMNNALGAVTVPSATNVLYTRREAEDAEREGGAALEGELDHDGVLRLRIRTFACDVAARAHALFAQHAARVRRLSFDLRDNPGGELSAAIDLAADALHAGSVVVTVVDGDGDAVVHRARGDAFGVPIEIVVNAGTASAAEIFAGALQAHGRARVVGEPTYGKGVAQAWFGAAMMDVARVLLPGGGTLDAGVVPNR